MRLTFNLYLRFRWVKYLHLNCRIYETVQAPALVKARKSEHGSLSSTLVVPEEQTSVCSCAKCGKIFSQPVELTVRTEGSLETYHACPHCFSRVNVSDNLKKTLDETAIDALANAVKETAKDIGKNKQVGCPNFLGYLKKRPKDSPIPDECLTCASLMQCMGFTRR